MNLFFQTWYEGRHKINSFWCQFEWLWCSSQSQEDDKLGFVQWFFCKVAWSRQNYCSGWVCKGDNCKEILLGRYGSLEHLLFLFYCVYVPQSLCFSRTVFHHRRFCVPQLLCFTMSLFIHVAHSVRFTMSMPILRRLMFHCTCSCHVQCLCSTMFGFHYWSFSASSVLE